MNQEKEIKNQRGLTVYLPNEIWEKLDSFWRQKKIKSKTRFFINCVENAEEMVKMEAKVLEMENLKEQIFELQEDNHSYSLKSIDLKRQIASLKDGLEYHRDMADSYAKVLKEIWDKVDDAGDKFIDLDMSIRDAVVLGDAKIYIIDDIEKIKKSIEKIKKSIPETALRRI